MPDLRADLLRILVENGLTADGGHPHSWRCSDKGRYPDPCSCPTVLVDDILELVLPLLAGAWQDGLTAGADRWKDAREFGDPPVNPWTLVQDEQTAPTGEDPT